MFRVKRLFTFLFCFQFFPIIPIYAQTPNLLEELKQIKKLDFCGEPVPLNYPDVKERFEKEFMLILWDRPQILLYLKRAPRYMPVIEKILKDHGLPEDLKYMPVIESALRPHAGSYAGAVGFWQFMESTGNNNGLKINDNIDERRNIFRATEAASTYLKTLKDSLGTWTLAAAAYNMGEYGLMEAIEKQGVRDYYRLYLPLETQRYILRLVTIKLIFTNPKRFGFDLSRKETYPLYHAERITVTLDSICPIRWIAEYANTDFKVIKDLNPELRGYELPAGEHTILIPKGSKNSFLRRFEKRKEKNE